MNYTHPTGSVLGVATAVGAGATVLPATGASDYHLIFGAIIAAVISAAAAIRIHWRGQKKLNEA